MTSTPSLLAHSTSQAQNGVIVVGAGPVGIRTAQELSRRDMHVTVLSAEAMTPYNRVRLTPLLGGDVQFSEIELLEDAARPQAFDLQLGQRVVRIEPDAQHVITADGGVWHYDTLVLATGSRAFVPSIPGNDQKGVFTFRTADDASALIARSFSARKIAVIGGGLLGLEAARGMRRRQCDVVVIEHESHLMPRQLDKAGGQRLSAQIEELGIKVKTGTAVRDIIGADRVTGLSFANGDTLDCDTVILCTGVRANIDLAQRAGLGIGRGVRVNDAMQTSVPSIYAVGECAEHNGQMFGLVGPGYAQAEVAASVIAGENAKFNGAAPTTRLKVVGADVFSVGNIEQLEVQANVRSHIWQTDEGYRRIFLQQSKLVGALALGPWEQANQVQDAIQKEATVYPWMLYRFRNGGDLWPERDLSPSEMPDSATLCNCTGVTCGQVRGAIAVGCASVQEVGVQTGAGTVCGTCRPLTAELLDAGAKPQALPMWKPLLALSCVAGLMALIPLMSGAVPLPTSYDPQSLRVWLWQDNIVKQWSGFILLSITIAAFVIGLRKRLRIFDRFGSFDAWRLVHLGIGLSALVGFFAHTGFGLGSGWNLALGLCFVVVVLVGSIAGLATGADHELRARQIGSSRKPPRNLPVWFHVLSVWPLPLLILFHVLASYAY